MGKRAGTVSSSKKKSTTPPGGVLEQIKLLRNFCPPSFTENDLSDCLSQSGYNVELAAERLMTGQYMPKIKAKSVTAAAVKTAPISSASKSTAIAAPAYLSSSSTPSTASSPIKKKRPCPEASDAGDRPEKKRSSLM